MTIKGDNMGLFDSTDKKRKEQKAQVDKIENDKHIREQIRIKLEEAKKQKRKT